MPPPLFRVLKKYIKNKIFIIGLTCLLSTHRPKGNVLVISCLLIWEVLLIFSHQFGMSLLLDHKKPHPGHFVTVWEQIEDNVLDMYLAILPGYSNGWLLIDSVSFLIRYQFSGRFELQLDSWLEFMCSIIPCRGHLGAAPSLLVTGSLLWWGLWAGVAGLKL